MAFLCWSFLLCMGKKADTGGKRLASERRALEFSSSSIPVPGSEPDQWKEQTHPLEKWRVRR